MTELKPCPFCGGEAEYSKINTSNTVPFGTVQHFVTCKKNCLEGLYARGNTKEEAIEAWNTRPNPWHTGTPTETGEYLVCRVPEAGYLFRYNQLCVFSDLMGILDHKIFYIGEVGKNSFENITDSVIAWQKIEPYEASKERE